MGSHTCSFFNKLILLYVFAMLHTVSNVERRLCPNFSYKVVHGGCSHSDTDHSYNIRIFTMFRRALSHYGYRNGICVVRAQLAADGGADHHSRCAYHGGKPARISSTLLASASEGDTFRGAVRSPPCVCHCFSSYGSAYIHFACCAL